VRAALAAVAIALALALALALVGCGGSEGQVELQVVSPLARPFAGLARARLSVLREGATPIVQEVAVGAGGEVELDLSLPATGVIGDVRLEGLDAAGAVQVRGRLPPLELFASTGILKLWVAPVGQVAALPVALPVGAARPAAVALPYGALLAGGEGAGGPIANVSIWNQFFLELQAGAALPGARRDLTGVGADAVGGVYLYGGADDSGAPKADLWRFDTTTPPMGTYATLTTPAGTPARAGARAVELAGFALVAGGEPAGEGALLISLPGSAVIAPQVTLLPGAPRGVAALAAVGGGALLAGAGPAERFTTTPAPAFAPVSAPAALAALVGARAATLPDGRVLLGCGRDAQATLYVFEPASATIAERPAALPAARADCTLTAVGGEVLVAGGRDGSGAALASALVLDAGTLAVAREITLPEPRTDHTAIALGNGSILLAGGRTTGNTVLTALALYTPEKL